MPEVDGGDMDVNEVINIDIFHVSVHNRFVQRTQDGAKNGGDGFVSINRKRKKASSSSSDAFAAKPTDEKLFEQLNRNYEKISHIKKKQQGCRGDMRDVNKCYRDLERRIIQVENLSDHQRWNTKVQSPPVH